MRTSAFKRRWPGRANPLPTGISRTDPDRQRERVLGRLSIDPWSGPLTRPYPRSTSPPPALPKRRRQRYGHRALTTGPEPQAIGRAAAGAAYVPSARRARLRRPRRRARAPSEAEGARIPLRALELPQAHARGPHEANRGVGKTRRGSPKTACGRSRPRRARRSSMSARSWPSTARNGRSRPGQSRSTQ